MNVDSKTEGLRLFIRGLIAPIRLWILSIAYHQFYTVVRIANYTLCWKIWFGFALKQVYGSDNFLKNFIEKS